MTEKPIIFQCAWPCYMSVLSIVRMTTNEGTFEWPHNTIRCLGLEWEPGDSTQ